MTTPAEPVTVLAPRPVTRTMLVQRWHDLCFLHWPAAPQTVAPFLPPGTRPDTIDGLTYVGLIGFRMVRLGLFSGPGLPYLGTFCETNVRLYSVDDQGRRGVVFLSLDAERLVPVLVAQASLRLPYKWSSMRLSEQDGVLRYSCWRFALDGDRGGSRDGRLGGGPRSRMAIRLGAHIVEPTPLEHFLTARWGLHVHAHGRTLYVPNVHPQWTLQRAELVELDDELVAATGLPAPEAPPVSVLYSPGLPVRFGPPVPA